MAAPRRESPLQSTDNQRAFSRSPRRLQPATLRDSRAHVAVEITKLDGSRVMGLELPRETTIRMIKEELAGSIGVEAAEQRLALNGNVLKDGDTLASLGSCVRLDWIRVCRRFLLTGSSDSTLRLWDLSSDCELVQEFKGHQSWVMAVAVDWSSSLALTASDDFTLRLWDLKSGRAVRELCGHSASVLCVAADWKSKQALSGSFDRTLRLWDLGSGKTIRKITGHKARVQCVLAAEGLTQALSASADCTLRLWNISLTPGEVTSSVSLRGHRSTVTCAEVNWARGRAVSRSKDSLRLWDLVSGTCLSCVDCCCDFRGMGFDCCCADCIAVDWDSGLVLSNTGCKDGFDLKFWQIIDGKTFHRRSEEQMGEPQGLGPLLCLAVDWTSDCAVGGSKDGSISVWGVGSGTLAQTWSGRGGTVKCLALQPE